MPDPRDAETTPYLQVAFRIERRFDEVLGRGQTPHAFVRLSKILRRKLPNPNFPVLVAGEDLLAGNYNRFYQSAARFEPGLILQIFPDPYVLAIGAGVQQRTRRSYRINVALFSKQKTDQVFVVVE